MKFHQKEIPLNTRIKNLLRLTPKKEMIEIISKEYASLYGVNYEIIFNNLWLKTEKFQKKYYKKIERKEKIKDMMKAFR